MKCDLWSRFFAAAKVKNRDLNFLPISFPLSCRLEFLKKFSVFSFRSLSYFIAPISGVIPAVDSAAAAAAKLTIEK